jgi:hypothetical protein
LLSDSQIDRYSRQIILPQVGGIGQQRLLAARVRVLAEIEDLTPALNYLAGAGIGTIRLDPDSTVDADFIADIRELNPEVRIEPAAQMDPGEILLVLAGSDRVIEAARRINETAASGQVICARLGAPYLIAVLNSRPPCLACAAPELLVAVRHGESAALASMAAAVETIKLLLAAAPEDSRLIQLSDYELRSSRIDAGKRCTVCDAATPAGSRGQQR